MDYNEMKSRKEDIDVESEFVKSVIRSIVRKHSAELDDFVDLVRRNLQLIKEAVMTEYDDESLQMQIIKLPTLLYLVGSGLEDIGAESEIAEYKRKELYNATIESMSTTTYTIPDKKARAEKITESEGMMEKIYDRSYKKLKSKIDHAIKLLESLKKVCDYRIAKINKGKGGDGGQTNTYS